MCPTGERLFLHEIIKDLKKEEMEDQSYCDDCDIVKNPKCSKCIGS